MGNNEPHRVGVAKARPCIEGILNVGFNGVLGVEDRRDPPLSIEGVGFEEGGL